MEDKPTLLITADDGQQKEMTILLTFESDSNHKKYVLFYDEDDASDQVYAMEYDDQGNLSEVSDEAGWQMIEETFNAFMESQNDKDDAD